MGALLSQLGALPERQLQHWWLSRQQASAAAATVQHWDLEVQPVEALSQLLQECCGAFSGVEPLSLDFSNIAEDHVGQLLQWVVGAMGQQQQQQQRWQEDQEEGEEEEGQAQQQQQQQGVHPAEALRQLLDVLLSALQYRHMLSMQQ
jgi:hypothetical protein